MTRHRMFVALASLVASIAGYATEDISRGAQTFRACAACHSLALGEHRTGPSLAAVYGRKAGSAVNFHRYSEALRKADVVWNEKTLDAWLRDPAAFIPGNGMTYQGLPDARA